MEKIKSWLGKFGIYFLILLMGLSLRFCAIFQKHGYFYDEPFTLSVSTPANLSPEGKVYKTHWTFCNFQKHKDYKTEDIKKSVFGTKGGIKALYRDLVKLRNSTIDQQHTNFYYSIIRTINSGLDGTNYKKMFFRCYTFNFIIYLISFFFMFKLLSLIKNDKKFISLGLFFAYACTGWISNTILAREYELMSLMYVVATYISLILFNKIKNNEIITYKKVGIYSVCLAIFSLSGYFTTIYEVFLLFILIGTCIYYKKYDHLKKIIIILETALLIIWIIYPNYYSAFFSNEYTQKTNSKLLSIGITYKKILLDIQNCTSVFYFNLLFYKGMLLILITCWITALTDKYILKNKFKLVTDKKLSKQEIVTIEVLFILAFCWTAIVLSLTPFLDFRFFSPSFGVVCMLWILATYRLANPLIYIITFMYMLFSICPIYVNSNNPFLARIGYLRETTNAIIPEKYKDYPIVFAGNNWSFNAHYMYLRDNRYVRFENNLPPRKNYDLKKYILICDNFKNPRNVKFISRYYFSRMFFVDTTKK